MRAGDDARRAVRLGEVGERPHRVADGRDVRLRQRDELVVGVDRLRRLAGQDRDRRQRRHEAARIEHALDDRQHARRAPGSPRRACRTRAGCRCGSCARPRSSCPPARRRTSSSRRQQVVGERVDERRARSRPRRSCSRRAAMRVDVPFERRPSDRTRCRVPSQRPWPIYALGDLAARDPSGRVRAPGRDGDRQRARSARSRRSGPRRCSGATTGASRSGARTSIQDGSVIHCTAEHPTVIGDDCVIGHLVAPRVLHDRGRRARRVGLDRAAPRRSCDRARSSARARVVPNDMEVPTERDGARRAGEAAARRGDVRG